MRIGIYGGSFDPVHRGHLLVAQAAREELSLDRLYFVPAASSPFKPDHALAPAALRLRLLRLALAGRPECELDDLEIRRGGVSYSIDTVRIFKERHSGAKLFYLIGTDHASTLGKWKESGELARLAEFVIIPRPGVAEVEAPPEFVTHRLLGFPLGVSASQIRERVRRGLPIDQLTPVAVAEAIRNNHLYL